MIENIPVDNILHKNIMVYNRCERIEVDDGGFYEIKPDGISENLSGLSPNLD